MLQTAFLKAAGTTNHHDLGLFSVGANAPGPERGRVGLYHLAWEVPSINDLAAGRDTLARLGALVGQSDHGATKSLYGKDPAEAPWVVLGCLLVFFFVACWGYDPQRGFGGLTKRGGPP